MAREGSWRDALREFGEAAGLDRRDSRPDFNAGLVRATRSDWPRARSDFQRATKRDSGNWPAWWMLGFAEEQLGNRSAALAAYRAAIRIDTSLFDTAVNPFAERTRLNRRVLSDTEGNRLLRATLPGSKQATDPGRVARFFQMSAATVPAASPAPRGQNLRREDEPLEPAAPPPTLPPQPAATPDSAPGVHPGVVQPRPRPGGEGGNSGGPADIQSARPLASATPPPAPR
jgi:tetratricopeptide (TPR) repeat protein